MCMLQRILCHSLPFILFPIQVYLFLFTLEKGVDWCLREIAENTIRVLMSLCWFIGQASRENIRRQISEATAQLDASKGAVSRGTPQQAFALIIDGKSLTYALEDGMKNKFLELALNCASVICCRSSPKQKALVCFHLFFNYCPLLTLWPFLFHFLGIIGSCMK